MDVLSGKWLFVLSRENVGSARHLSSSTNSETPANSPRRAQLIHLKYDLEMAYVVPFLFDENGKYQGFFAPEIDGKRLIVVAEDGPRFQEFFQLARKLAGAFGQRMGIGPQQATSFPAAVKEVLERSPNLQDGVDVTFISDTDPLFAELVASLRNQIARLAQARSSGQGG